MSDDIRQLYEEALKTHLESGGKEEDFAFACRERRGGGRLPIGMDLASYRAMDAEQLEEELEDMQNDLDDTVDAIEEYEDEYGDPSTYEGELAEEYEELLDERFAVEFYIAEVMKLI